MGRGPVPKGRRVVLTPHVRSPRPQLRARPIRWPVSGPRIGGQPDGSARRRRAERSGPSRARGVHPGTDRAGHPRGPGGGSRPGRAHRTAAGHDAEEIRHARALLTQPENTITSIAKLLGVSRTTLYKYVPELAAGRDSLVRSEPHPALPGLADCDFFPAPVCPAPSPHPEVRRGRPSGVSPPKPNLGVT
ncbi:helix-turn-helix domain-containing protein [Streptomyces sp. NPDC006208]|uniref:helix-turn-helix domain-containing protein n=1 Tax=Streptomyces sp. NPDC006208 TaxID=3156734 RepID=UPI0033B106A0